MSQSGAEHGTPRICMPSFSGFARNLFRGGLAEAQDVLASCDDVEIITLEPAPGFRFREKWLSRFFKYDISRKAVLVNPGLRPVRLVRDYELFVLVCPWWGDVWYANAISNWRDRCRISVCWIDELWKLEVKSLTYWWPILSRFDYVFLGISGSGKAVADAIGRPCYEISGGVDTIRFSPHPNPPARVIDVYSIGRRLDPLHQAFLSLASRRGLFYVYDTLDNPGNSKTWNLRDHRNMIANMAKRSRFFTVMPGKVNVPEETAGQVDLGFRYFEGSAAGTIMVGQSADCAAFRQHFDWPDAVIRINPDGSNATEVICDLLAEPERLAEIGRRNAEEALRRHDWVYRWKEIFRIVGLKPKPELEKREKRLRELAELTKEKGEYKPKESGNQGVRENRQGR